MSKEEKNHTKNVSLVQAGSYNKTLNQAIGKGKTCLSAHPTFTLDNKKDNKNLEVSILDCKLLRKQSNSLKYAA